MAITYGIISDLHGIDIKAVPPTIQILINEGIDALVLNGDLLGERSGYEPQEYLATLMDLAGRSGLETYVLPGSHEEVSIYEPVIAHFSKKYGNIINTFEQPKVDKGDHHIVFLQGSDWRAGGATDHGYSLEEQNVSGIYENKGAHIRVINMNDLAKLISDPEKTLVFSHIPRRFDNPETGVDMAQYWNVQQQFQLGDQVFEAGSVLAGIAGDLLKEKGVPIESKRENRGNDFLRYIYTQLGVRKNITGHFHESAGRAHDLEGLPIEECTFVPELFYNASCMDRLMAGMVTLDGAKAAYENIDLRKYFREAEPKSK
jgi:hypothetical protein